jgi:hypothetical protein
MSEKTEEVKEKIVDTTKAVGDGVIGLTEMVLTGEILATLFGWKQTDL